MPAATSPALADVAGDAERTSGPSRRRIVLVSTAALALFVGAVATSFAASPTSGAGTTGAGTTGTATTSAWIAPAAVPGLGDDAGAFEHGRFGGHGGFRDITIGAIDGSSLDLETSDGWTRTITVSDGVELTKGGQAIELSDLAVGDEIRLRQEVADDGTITVTGIAVVVPRVAGEVGDLSATGFTVTGRDGAVWSISLTAETVFRYGSGDGTLADIADGDNVLVLGTSSGDNALTATMVAVRGDVAAGTVTATTADSITIEGRAGGTLTIHVDADTTYRARGAGDASLADIAVGDGIAVSGRARSDGSIDAEVVVEGGRFDGLGGGRGGNGHGGPGFPGGPFLPGSDDDAEGPTDAG